ncbi:MAG: hypothetical protein E7470_05685 [Ruminococcaceae bacterium]|nr:hypothetical protein [Oscillospiraceae bacterium]
MDRIALRTKLGVLFGRYRYVLLILLIGVTLMLLPDLSSRKNANQDVQTKTETTVTLAQQLETILSQVKGAGKVSVMLTVGQGEEIIYQTDQSGGTSDSGRQDTVIITDADRAQQGLIRQINPPTYQGALIVCQGADSPAVRLAIIEAIGKVTGLDSSRISILKMK